MMTPVGSIDLGNDNRGDDDDSRGSAWRRLLTIRPESIKIFVSFLVKMIAYAELRVLYPMNRFLTNDWGLTTEQFSALLAISELTSLGGTLISPMIDGMKHGITIFIIGSIVVMAIATAGLAFLPGVVSPDSVFPLLMMCRGTFGFAISAMNIAIQTFLLKTAENPDDVVSKIESSWSLAAIILVPMTGAVYSAFNTPSAPFYLLAIMQMMALPLVIRYLFDCCGRKTSMTREEKKREPTVDPEGEATSSGEPEKSSRDAPPHHDDENEEVVENGGSSTTTFASDVKAAIFAKGLMVFNISALLFHFSQNFFLTEFGFLLYDQYHLTEDEAGTSTVLLGFAELLGVSLISLVSRRRLRRGVDGEEEEEEEEAKSKTRKLLRTLRITKGSSRYDLEIVGILFFVALLAYALLGVISYPALLAATALATVPSEYGFVARFSRVQTFGSMRNGGKILGVHLVFVGVGRLLGAFVAGPALEAIQNHFLTCMIPVSTSFISVLLLFLIN